MFNSSVFCLCLLIVLISLAAVMQVSCILL